ncbi:MAG: hypothetical protein GYA57_15735 [Myxococcales bacterium]|nr:hypothetical protein [Myxococcales bacterium]
MIGPVRRLARFPPRGALVALLAATALAAAGRASARGTGPDPLGPAYEALDALDYEEALQRLESVLARTDLSAEDRNRALEMEAACRVYLGDREAALAGFAALHRRDPGWRLSDDYPPRVRAVYEEAFRQPREPIRVEIRPLPGPAVRQGVLTVQIESGADAIDRLWLVVPRPAGEEEVRRLFVAAGPSFEARLPEDLVREGRPIDYVIEAHAPSGHVLARRNDRWTAEPPPVEPGPQTFPPAFPPPPPPPLPPDDEDEVEPAWYQSWWFWTIVGVAAGGAAATGIYFGVAGTGDGPRDGSGGNWVVW